uniref:Iron-binding zinc finger CDGSH type domain-containing protein n=1 Tax=Romanomermis culicivorax TaxID=13658 RepID=A0A915HG04_ROMCU
MYSEITEKRILCRFDPKQDDKGCEENIELKLSTEFKMEKIHFGENFPSPSAGMHMMVIVFYQFQFPFSVGKYKRNFAENNQRQAPTEQNENFGYVSSIAFRSVLPKKARISTITFHQQTKGKEEKTKIVRRLLEGVVYLRAPFIQISRPFCDGSHNREDTNLHPVRYVPEEDEDVWLCCCKQTENRPFCDGSHKNLPEETADEEDERFRMRS